MLLAGKHAGQEPCGDTIKPQIHVISLQDSAQYVQAWTVDGH